MTLYLRNFGLIDWEDEAKCLALMRYVCEHGKVFRGYRCNYLYKNIGAAEMIVTVIDENNSGDNRVIGFNNHKMGNCFWNLRVTAIGLFGRDEMNPYSFRVIFSDLDGNSLLPINLIHADVIPSYIENDIVCMQVTAFPTFIDYYVDEDSSKAARNSGTIMGKKLIAGKGIFPGGLFSDDEENKDLVLLVGEVLEVEKRKININGNEVVFWDASVETPYGPIELAHTVDIVSDEQRHLVCRGSYVVAGCILSGDVAVGEYQGGAIYDEENCLRLIRSCMVHGDFDRLYNAMATDCVYLSPCAISKGREETIARLQNAFDKIKDKGVDHYTFSATVGAIEEGRIAGAKYFTGKRCIALSSETPDGYYGWMFVTTNDEGRITEIETVSGESNIYSVRLDKFEKIEEDEHEWIPVQTERDKEAWLSLIKDCYDDLDFSRSEFYFGMEPTITMTIQWEPGSIEGKEAVYAYFAKAVEEMKQHGKIFYTDIVPIPDNPEEHGLLISADDRRILAKFDISERERLQKVEMILWVSIGK